MTHLIGHALCHGLYKMRRDIGRIRFGYFVNNKDIGMTTLVDVEGGQDLVPVTIFNGHEMSLLEYAKDLTAQVQSSKKKENVSHNKSTQSAVFLPSFILTPFLMLLSYLNLNCGIPLPCIGINKRSVGHYVLTNIGTLNMQQGFAPLCPPLRAMGFTCAGNIRKSPVVVDGKIEIADIMTSTQTGDHRFGDASIFIPLHKVYKGYIEDPENFKAENYAGKAHWSEAKDQ